MKPLKGNNDYRRNNLENMQKIDRIVMNIAFAVIDMIMIFSISMLLCILLRKLLGMPLFFFPFLCLARQIYLKCMPSKLLGKYLEKKAKK